MLQNEQIVNELESSEEPVLVSRLAILPMGDVMKVDVETLMVLDVQTLPEDVDIITQHCRRPFPFSPLKTTPGTG